MLTLLYPPDVKSGLAEYGGKDAYPITSPG